MANQRSVNEINSFSSRRQVIDDFLRGIGIYFRHTSISLASQPGLMHTTAVAAVPEQKFTSINFSFYFFGLVRIASRLPDNESSF